MTMIEEHVDPCSRHLGKTFQEVKLEQLLNLH